MDLLAINAIVGLPAKNRNGKQLKELSAFLKGNNADRLKAARTLKYFTDSFAISSGLHKINVRICAK